MGTVGAGDFVQNGLGHFFTEVGIACDNSPQLRGDHFCAVIEYRALVGDAEIRILVVRKAGSGRGLDVDKGDVVGSRCDGRPFAVAGFASSSIASMLA